MNRKIGFRIFVSIFVCCMIISCESFKSALDSMGKSISEATSNISSRTNSTSTRYDPDKRADPDASNWDIDKLDTAKDMEYLTGVEKDVVLEMNKVRSDPKKYAELYIRPKIKYYNGKEYSEPGQITILTQEGVSAVNACIAALNRAKIVGLLIPERGLTLATKDHVRDQSETGQTGHNGNDRSTPVSRSGRYGKGQYIGENIDYGNNIGREIVCSLLIDDGVPSRGHRANIMKEDYTQTGVGMGTHPEYRNMCVIAYAKDYISN